MVHATIRHKTEIFMPTLKQINLTQSPTRCLVESW
jgi:hypothetical protein